MSTSNLQTNLARLSQSRAASQARKKRVRSSLAEFIDMRVQRPTPVAPAAVARRLAPAEPAPVGGTHTLNDGHGHESQAEVNGLNKEFESALNRMIKDSGGRIKVTSGYRSSKRQAELYAQAIKKYGSEKAARKWVAPPGKSNHNHGLAADIAGDKKWAHQNAAKYGLHFPLAHEDWHVEPINARSKRK